MSEMRCAYTYNGLNGGRKGQRCDRPWAEHCLGNADCADEMHNPACKLFIAGEWDRFAEAPKVRSMVHHTFHRPRRRTPSVKECADALGWEDVPKDAQERNLARALNEARRKDGE
jgi:hypothetical protein